MAHKKWHQFFTLFSHNVSSITKLTMKSAKLYNGMVYPENFLISFAASPTPPPPTTHTIGRSISNYDPLCIICLGADNSPNVCRKRFHITLASGLTYDPNTNTNATTNTYTYISICGLDLK